MGTYKYKQLLIVRLHTVISGSQLFIATLFGSSYHRVFPPNHLFLPVAQISVQPSLLPVYKFGFQ